jgi:hypothetical protein
MGQAMGQGGDLTHSGPSKAAEAMVALLIPPARREEILGDLHERYRAPGQYGLDAVCTIPLVIISRIRRTADAQVLLIQAFALYVSFLSAAWWLSRAFLGEPWGLLRLAVPAAMGIFGLIMEDAYASRAPRSPLKLIRGPVVGIALALVSQGVFRSGDPDLAVPRWIVFYGCAMSLLLCSAIRLLFPPAGGQVQAANTPAFWLKQPGGAEGSAKGTTLVLKSVAGVIAAAAAGAWMADHLALPKPRVITALLLMLIAYQLLKRG